MWIQTDKGELVNLEKMDGIFVVEPEIGYTVEIGGAAAVCAKHEGDYYKLFDCVSRADAENKIASIAKNLPRAKM